MIKLFGGKDQFESYFNAKKESKKLTKHFQAQFRIIDADYIESLESFVQNVEGLGMFSEVTIFLIKRITSNKKVFDYFTENYQNLNNLEIILWEDGNPDGRNKLIQILKKQGTLFIYDELKEREIKSWVISQLKSENISLNSKQIDYLVQNVGIEKYTLLNELKKVKLYIESQNKKELSEEELNTILGFDIKGNIWKFLDYYSGREKKKCLTEYLKLTTFEDNTQYLISMIARELSIIAQIKYSETNNLDLRDLKLHPFVLQKSQNNSKNFKWNEVKVFLSKLLNLDFAIKKGDIDEKLGMSLYLLSL